MYKTIDKDKCVVIYETTSNETSDLRCVCSSVDSIAKTLDYYLRTGDMEKVRTISEKLRNQCDRLRNVINTIEGKED